MEFIVEQLKINIPNFGELDGEFPIVILGPNGSGKTKLAQNIAQMNKVSAISAQRRTWVDDNLPVQDEKQLRNNIQAHIDQWKQHSWQPTQEINFILSNLIQDHTNILTKRNEDAIASNTSLEPVDNTNLILLQGLWNRLFPKRKLEIGGFFPKVTRLDISNDAHPYQLREMSDGERTVLYMAARIMTAEHPVILVDEPELHMHSRLAVKFWDEAEKLKIDCKFIYITHDLNFALSRRNATILVTQSSGSTKLVKVDEIPSSIAAEVLGAATLPFYAKRIILYEGEQGKAFASEFISAWFNDNDTFTLPCGNRDSVCAVVLGLKKVNIQSADIIGLVDRDYYSDDALIATTPGVNVLSLHEIESILCDKDVVFHIAEHLGKTPDDIWQQFLTRVHTTFQGETFSNIVSRRVRSRVGDLLDGVFTGNQVVSDLMQTKTNHCKAFSDMQLPNKIEIMFDEESGRVTEALSGDTKKMLEILPGKHLLNILSDIFGFKNHELASLAIRALDNKISKEDNTISILGQKLEKALCKYLPPRKTPPSSCEPIPE